MPFPCVHSKAGIYIMFAGEKNEKLRVREKMKKGKEGGMGMATLLRLNSFYACYGT